MNFAAELAKLSLAGLIDEKGLIPCIDLTLLTDDAKNPQVRALQSKASQFQVATICIMPQQLHYLRTPMDINVATVINFPTGLSPQEAVIEQLEKIIQYPFVNEIDYVFPYQDYLAGHTDKALMACNEVIRLCHKHHLLCKVIIETGAFENDNLLYTLSRELIDRGADFLKTSTGKIAQGASLLSAYILTKAINVSGTNCGIKISGGVKTFEQARQYAVLTSQVLNKAIDKAWFRIGASSLLDELIANRHS